MDGRKSMNGKRNIRSARHGIGRALLRGWTGLWTAVVVVIVAIPSHAFAQNVSAEVRELEKAVGTYCVRCHNDRMLTAGLTLQPLSLNDVVSNAQIWEKVVRRLRTKTMPPVTAPRPPADTYDALASFLEDAIDRDAAAFPKPGRTEPVHRLNRTEYQNAIRDLLALEIDVSELIPADDQSYGFDNIAGVLKMSPSRLDRYVSAATEISSLAVGASTRVPTAETFRVRSDLSQYGRMDGLSLGTRGGMAVKYLFPRDAEYDIRVDLIDFMVQSGEFDEVQEPHDIEIAIDGERQGVWTLAPMDCPYEGCAGLDENYGNWQVRVPVKAGPHLVSATFVKKTSALSETWLQPFARPHGELDHLMYQPHIGTLTITGPFNETGAGDTPSRRRILTCRPSSASEEAECARTIASTLGRRAYRRPLVDDEVDRLMATYRQGQTKGGFENGIENVVAAILVSPNFLYRTEHEPPGVAPGEVYAISDTELASRLSFFLWSSVPDDELLTLATQGQLSKPDVLGRQVRRMLADARSKALATTFAGQWFNLRNISAILPNQAKFPNFSDNLRQDFVTETTLFFDSIVKENRSVVELLTADYTFANENLAKFYGIPGVYGTDFRRVPLTGAGRRGLLGQGSILSVSSYPDRTSPVKRGKWILENILGTPPPPPPPNVPELENDGDGVVAEALSMRERMAKHRTNPVCASCHSIMDPLGLAMEHFDAIGRWRNVDESGDPLDVAGNMPDGTPFEGPAELRELLVRNPEQFATVVTEKLLVYALGRGLEYYDASAVRQIVRTAAEDQYSIGSVIEGIVKSTPMTMRRAAPGSVSAD